MRALEVLEFFDAIQRGANVTEIAHSLGYPQSSTSALVRTLCEAGYLTYDRGRRTYLTSPRAALAGHWLDGALVAEGRILAAGSALSRAAGELVLLSGRNGPYVRPLQSAGRNGAKPPLSLLRQRPLTSDATGLCLLSALSDIEATRLIWRANAESATARPRSLKEHMQLIAHARAEGWVYVRDDDGDAASISALLPGTGGQGILAMTVWGACDRLEPRVQELAGLLMKAVAQAMEPAPSA